MSGHNVQDTGSKYDGCERRPFAEWPRELQAVQVVLCLNGHDPDVSDEFVAEEVGRLGLLGMSDEEMAAFVGRHLRAHHN